MGRYFKDNELSAFLEALDEAYPGSIEKSIRILEQKASVDPGYLSEITAKRSRVANSVEFMAEYKIKYGRRFIQNLNEDIRDYLNIKYNIL